MPLARLMDDLRVVSEAGAEAARGGEWLSLERLEGVRAELLHRLAALPGPDAANGLLQAREWERRIAQEVTHGRARLDAQSGEAAKAAQAGAAYARAGLD